MAASPCGEEELVRRQPLAEGISRAAEGAGSPAEVTPATESGIRSLAGGGQPLTPSERSFFEPRFGRDFSSVRIHSDVQAAEAARSVKALAYTMGSAIVFGAGQYQPETVSGRRLLAHELAHVIQQGGDTSKSQGVRPASIQRLGDPSQAPPGMSCPIATTSSANPVATNVLFPISSSSLSAAAIADIDSFVSRWQAVGTNPTVRVDGFASTDGPQSMNWTLSCNRASAVIRELETPSSGDPGIPNQFIEIFAQGETSEFGAGLGPNRRATIRANLTVPPPPPPPETITSETVATTPGARTRTTIGVGEEVNLTHSPGSAAWTTTVGPAPLSATNGDRVIFTAPDTAPATTQRITVTAGAATISFDVLAPTSVTQERVAGTGVKHTVNRADSGIALLTFLGPDTVNFSRVRWRELDDAGVATGVYSCNPASGGHCGAGGGGAPCPDNPLSDTVVAGKGTQDLPPPDCAYSGHCGTAPPFAPGSITLTIPYEYKVGAGAFHRFATVTQLHTLAADASTLTTSKAGATGTTTVAAATAAIPQCP